jgi:hypothetical protein
LVISPVQGSKKGAMLGSNQRPPPCKLGQDFPSGFDFVEASRLSMRFSLFSACLLFCYVRVCPAPVAAWLQHTVRVQRPRLGAPSKPVPAHPPNTHAQLWWLAVVGPLAPLSGGLRETRHATGSARGLGWLPISGNPEPHTAPPPSLGARDHYFRTAWAAARRAPGTRKGEQDT